MSRNKKTLMIGGALILIALLLVCGPLSGRFGGPASVEEPPSVAAGPPAGVGVAGAGAAGAIAGAGVGESQLAAAGQSAEALDESERCRRLEDETDEEWRRRVEQIENEGGFDEDCARWAAGSGYAGLAAVTGGAGAAASAGTGSGSGSDASSQAASDGSNATRGAGRLAAGAAGAGAAVAAGTAAGIASGAGSSGSGAGIGGPTTADLPMATIQGQGDWGATTTPIAGSGINGAGGLAENTAATIAAGAANAANIFDGLLAPVGAAGPGAGGGFSGAPGLDGKVVSRFAPPVAAPGGGVYNVASAAQPFGIGKGSALAPCDTPGSGCRNLRGIAGNPPIIPGGRPGPPANPPIIPGGRPSVPGQQLF